MEWLSLSLFSADECRRIVGELVHATSANANVYGVANGGVVDERFRRVRRIEASKEIFAKLSDAFARLQPELAAHFGAAVTHFEPPQFLRYEVGDYFVAHQDGNTPLIRDDSAQRRISAIVFLSDPHDYAGGTVRFVDRGEAPANRGTLLAFRSELTHEVTPVERGERYTVVTWYR